MFERGLPGVYYARPVQIRWRTGTTGEISISQTISNQGKISRKRFSSLHHHAQIGTSFYFNEIIIKKKVDG